MNWKQPIPTGLESVFGEDHRCNLLYRELIYRACNKEMVVRLSNKFTKLKRGQVVFGRNQFAKYLGWTPSTVRNVFKRLQKWDVLEDKQANRNYTIVSIKNYDEIISMDKQKDKKRTSKGQVKDTSKSVETKRVKEKTSKNSLTACTDKELRHIAKIKNIPLSSVVGKHKEIIDGIADGSFQERKYGKTVYHTLSRWMQMAVNDGKIKQIKSFDDIVEEQYGI